MESKKPFGSRGYDGDKVVKSRPRDAAAIWRLSKKGECKEALERLCAGPFNGTSAEILVACGVMVYGEDCAAVLRSLDLEFRKQPQPRYGVRADFFEHYRREFRRILDAATVVEREKVWTLAKEFAGGERTTIRWVSDVRTVGSAREAKAKKYAIQGAYDCRKEIKAAGGQWDAQRRIWIVTDKQLEILRKQAASKADASFWRAWSRVRAEPLIEKKGRP